MKPRAKSLLTLVSVAFLGILVMLSIAAPAQAQVTETLVSNNGVDCYRRDGGTWPENGSFFYCGTSSSIKSEMLTLVKNLRDSYPHFESAMTGMGAKIAIFANPLDRYKFMADTAPTTPELEAEYAASADEYGRTFLPPAPLTTVYENVTAGTFPAMNPVSLDRMRHAVVHEFGHQYDNAAIAGTGSARSAKSTFLRTVRKDETQMELQAEGASTAQTLRTTYDYFLVPHGTTEDPTPTWKELYAEEFAYYVISNHGGAWGITQLPVAADALTPYFRCSRLVAEKHLTSGADPTPAQFQTTGCDGAVLCYVRESSGAYPDNGVNAYVCGPSANTDNPANLKDNLPSATRADDLYFGLATELDNAANDSVRLKLAEQRVMYFFFRTRAEANEFFDNQRPMSANSQYQSTAISERCGHTHYNINGVIVAAAIFDQCALSTGDTANPSLLRTGIHETGRAFALAFQKGGTGDPSATSGFTTMYNADAITPSNWSSYTPADKDAFICGLFGTVGNSQLERDMGAHATQTGPVCTGGTVNSPWRSGTTYHTPSQIALNDDKVADSIIGSKAKTWAEEFTVLLLGKTSPSDLFPITDWFFGYDNPPTVGGVTPKRSMNCTRFVVETYRNTGNKPTNAQLTGAGCPTHPDYN